MKSLGLSIIFIGIAIIFVGILFFLKDKIPFLGELPGDIKVRGENSSFYFPITTCIIISIVLSIVFNFITHFFSK